MNGRSALHLRLNRSRQRGAIFITALGIIVILSGLVLVFAQDMRTEAIGSANRMAYIQADAVERGAEQWVLAQVEASPGDASTITETPAEAIQISSGSAVEVAAATSGCCGRTRTTTSSMTLALPTNQGS
jgi:Tfp pilus assembly protein PilX